jgi:transcriptional regulator with XRE-family HTH domain
MRSTTTTWGERVRARRKELGLSLADVARRAGCDISVLSRIENGIRGVSDALKPRLAAALETDPAELFAYEMAA